MDYSITPIIYYTFHSFFSFIFILNDANHQRKRKQQTEEKFYAFLVEPKVKTKPKMRFEKIMAQ